MTPEALDAGDLARRRWSFGEAGQAPYAPQLLLLEDGRIGGYFADNETFWSLEPEGLVLLDAARRPTTRLTEVSEVDGRLRLEGRYLRGDTWHALAEVAPADAPAGPDAAIAPVRVADPLGREHLLIVCAGPGSRHREWQDWIEPSTRSWDLCVCAGAGNGPGDASDDAPTAEWRAPLDPRGRFPTLHRLLHPDSPLWSYRYVMLADDGLRMSGLDVNRLFHRMVAHDLLIAQPAFSALGRITHELTCPVPGSRLRYTDFVEIKAPLFAAASLRLVVPSFRDAEFGFGLDHLWGHLIGRPQGRIAIIDAVEVSHDPSVPAPFDLDRALAEEASLRQRYGLVPSYRVHGGLGAPTGGD